MPDFPQVGLEAVLSTAAFEKGGQVVNDVLDKTTDSLEETEEGSAGAGGALDALGGVAAGVATGGLTLLIRLRFLWQNQWLTGQEKNMRL